MRVDLFMRCCACCGAILMWRVVPEASATATLIVARVCCAWPRQPRRHNACEANFSDVLDRREYRVAV